MYAGLQGSNENAGVGLGVADAGISGVVDTVGALGTALLQAAAVRTPMDRKSAGKAGRFISLQGIAAAQWLQRYPQRLPGF